MASKKSSSSKKTSTKGKSSGKGKSKGTEKTADFSMKSEVLLLLILAITDKNNYCNRKYEQQ